MIWLLLDIGGRAYIRSRHTVHHTFPSLYKIIMCMTYASFFCNQSGSRKSLFLKPYRERAPAFFILLHIVCCAGGLMASVTASANGSQDGDIPDPAFPAAFLLSSFMAISWFYGALPWYLPYGAQRRLPHISQSGLLPQKIPAVVTLDNGSFKRAPFNLGTLGATSHVVLWKFLL